MCQKPLGSKKKSKSTKAKPVLAPGALGACPALDPFPYPHARGELGSLPCPCLLADCGPEMFVLFLGFGSALGLAAAQNGRIQRPEGHQRQTASKIMAAPPPSILAAFATLGDLGKPWQSKPEPLQAEDLSPCTREKPYASRVWRGVRR